MNLEEKFHLYDMKTIIIGIITFFRLSISVLNGEIQLQNFGVYINSAFYDLTQNCRSNNFF